MLDNSNADKSFDDEYEQEDVRVTAEELRNLWRSVRAGQPTSTAREAPAMNVASGGAPENGAALSDERAAPKPTLPLPPPWMFQQPVAHDGPSAQDRGAFPSLSSASSGPPFAPPLPRARRDTRAFTDSLHPVEDAFPQLAARPVVPPEQPLARRRPLTEPMPPFPTSTLSSDMTVEPFGWANFRHHSRWFLPAVLVLLFFVLVALVSLNGGVRLPPEAIGPMFFIFAAIGVFQAGALYYADANSNDTAWVLAVAGGIIAFLAAACFALFSTAFAFFLTILLLALGGLLLRRYSLVIRAGTAVVMGRFGKPKRTLYPGFNLRFPGEKVLGHVETGQKRCELPLTPIRLRSGEQVKLRVSAVYEVIPGEEHLAVRSTKDWNMPIQQRLATVVEDVVSMLTAADLLPPAGGSQTGLSLSRAAEAEGASSPLDALNAQLTTTLREQVADRGVVVLAVKAYLVDGPRAQDAARLAPPPSPTISLPPSSHPTLPLSADLSRAGRVVEGSGQALPHIDLPSPVIRHVAGMAAPSIEDRQAGAPEVVSSLFSVPVTGQGLPLVPPGGMSLRVSGTGQGVAPLSLRQLEQFYNDIVQQRITDSSTIRRLIAQFDAVAADPELSERAPFDPAGAARNLRQYLTSLERWGSGSQTVSPDSSAPPPQVH